ncbi:zinc-ribbon domain-containing protein [Asanoa siamensis]
MSNLRVLWRCSSCGWHWETAVANRTSGTGCPECAWVTRGRSRALAPAGQSLADLSPRIAGEFVENLDRPEFSPWQLRAGSQQRCRWRCGGCQHVWESTVANRTSGRGCPVCCNVGRRASRRRIAPGSATAESVAPHLLIEFVRNLSSPGETLGGLKPASLDRCEWRCAECGRVWAATVRNRVVSGSGCPDCGAARAARSRRVPKVGRTFAETTPGAAAQFLENLSQPGRGPAAMNPATNDLCRWRCDKGHEWVTTAASRAAGSGCARCRGNGQSRFEVEIAELIAAGTGATVLVDVSQVAGGKRWRIDLSIPSIGLLIDLDPAHWHRNSARDSRKAMAFAGHEYLRVRPTHLADVGGQICWVTDGGDDPWKWCLAMVPYLSARGATWTGLTPDQRATALAAAAKRWEQTCNGRPLTSAADAAPHLAAEFVANLSRPGVPLDWLRPKASDRIRWRCMVCRNQWDAMLYSRAAGTGCPSCATAATAARVRARALPKPGESLADLFPHIAVEMVPGGRTPDQLRPSSNMRCRWRCATCGHQWSTSPGSRVRGRGCPRCGKERTRLARTTAAPEDSLSQRHPGLASEFVSCVSEPGRTPSNLLPASNKKCRWRCQCGREWTTTVASRVAGTGCPSCGRKRTGQARATAVAGNSLAERFPEVAVQFVTNLDHPGRTPETLKSASHDRCRWRCGVCGGEWAAVVKNRTRNGTGCPSCYRRTARDGLDSEPT